VEIKGCPFFGNWRMDIYCESASWMGRISLSVVTITIHAMGVVSMAPHRNNIRDTSPEWNFK
jgi:hypothetical protein